MKNKFFNKVEFNPIIAAINDDSKIGPSLKSSCEIIFILKGNILNLKETVNTIRGAGKEVYIHVDLLEGLGRDQYALKFIQDSIEPDGIITTKASLIKKAKDLGLFAIQRLFILDSLSLETGIKSVIETKPDAIEILPGIMPKIVKEVSNKTKAPIIAGGLINDKQDVIDILKAGAIGVSTSNPYVWKM